MNELELYRQKKIAEYKKQLEQDYAVHGRPKGLTDEEYMKMKHKQKSSTTRRTHARGNHWNHHNLPKPKAEKFWWQ